MSKKFVVTCDLHYPAITVSMNEMKETMMKNVSFVLLRFHGINERISKKNYEELVVFYFSFIQNCDIQKLPEPHNSVHEL